jgi:poly(3-hydroxybutyrate) depolymerase
MAGRLAAYFCILIALAVNAQDINLRGKITGSGDAPVSGAIVTLIGQNMKDTTGSDGTYEIKHITDVLHFQELQPEYSSFIVQKGVLVFSIPETTPLKVELFDVKGNLLKREAMSNVPKGFYRFGIAENVRAANVLIIRVALGNDTKTFRYLPLENGSCAINRISAGIPPATENRLMKLMAIDDTVSITAEGYKEKKQAIVLYDQELDFTLEPESSASDTGRSAGCGKALGSFNKTGNNTMKSSGKNRTYRIDIPSDYDKDKPYRLIFGMHCMGGSADKVAGTTDQSKNYYGLKTQAQKDNIQCIYVAPLGNGDGTWQGEPDRTFFFDLQKLLKDSLCIDTTRVFSVGFSFGAMFTYALSLKYPEILRAAACNAPANFAMDQPPNRHIPLAYVQTTGTQDGTCPWERGSVGGKYCLLQHAEDNGCKTDNTIKLANSGTHVVTEFEDCEEGYPVRFMSHNGGHECNKTDQGSNVDWIPVEFWNFFKRF